MTRGWLERLAVLGALAGCVWAMSGDAEAQRPRHGFVVLRQGFVPDPHIMSGVMGGSIQANQYSPSCRGTIFPEPSHVVRSQTGFSNIRFVVSGQGDSTMMVQLPNGVVLCDDDGGEGLNPLIQTASPPGDIRIWVGVYNSSAQGQPYTIGITEMSHITANNLTAGPGPMPMPGPGPGPMPGPGPVPVSGIQPNAPALYGLVNLRAGFMPDPQVVAGNAGGPISAANVDPSCRGHITPQPSHVIMSQTGFRNLRIAVNGSLDTTLVVMLPNGQVLCNDDSEGTNPLVQASAPPGPIRVWVGAYSAGRTGPYNIGFTELSHIGPSSLPRPGAVQPNPGPGPYPGPGPGPGPIVVQPQPQPTPGEIVQMQVSIPVTLLGPGLDGNTIAVWHPGGAQPQQVRLVNRQVMVGSTGIAGLPPSMRDPIVTVMEQRNGTMLVRAEQPPMGRGDRGETVVLLVSWQGQPFIQDRWSGAFGARGPRWTR